MKKITYILMITMAGLLFSNCSDYLNQKSETIITDEDVFSDQNMTNAALANFYGRVDWGQRLSDEGWQFIYLDEASPSSGGPDYLSSYHDGWWRVYDYGLIRDINQFIVGVRSDAAEKLDAEKRKEIEAEARFIRAWTYFSMARGMGGMPIVEDNVYTYTSGMDITTLQVPRSTEAGIYDYIISECDSITEFLGTDPNANIHAARATKWAAIALKARAAIYAGSIAKYNALYTPDIVTAGNEVGIPASQADTYFGIAKEAALEIINSGTYRLYQENTNLGRNFYETLTSKNGNPEVIWALDYAYPGRTHQFSAKNVPYSAKVDLDANRITPVLNLVEAYEYATDRDGSLKINDASGNPIAYDNLSDIFADKDARLYGTIIYPGADFRGENIEYQAGQIDMAGNLTTGEAGSFDALGNVITSVNGPIQNSQEFRNKTGFNIRKYVEESKDAATRGRGSDMWFVRFRYAEVLLIASEATFELDGSTAEALDYLNQVRRRAGIQDLTAMTHDDLVNEYRVEFAFEDHRWWDLKRWRLADRIWNGDGSNPTAVQYSLFPYRIVDATSPDNGKWVFRKIQNFMNPNPRNFRKQNYYNFIDQDWLNKNPKMVKNPFQ